MTRLLARIAVLAVAGLALVFFSPGTANAEECTITEWHKVEPKCLNDLPDEKRTMCKTPPVPSAPDSGMAGWFATDELPADSDVRGQYSKYGYAGYDLPTYDIGCTGSPIPDGDTAGNSLANLEFTLASGIIGASNGLRQAAWEPAGMWGWANEFVEKATTAIYDKVFSVFGAITVALVGLYLIWRSRQADMSMAVTTAGWAVLVLAVVTAVAQWPTESANFADEGLSGSLSVIQDAVGPPEGTCDEAGPCEDLRSAALRASDMATGEILYANWIRSVLGQSEEVTYKEDSDGNIIEDADGNPIIENGNTAYKYGPALYDATAFTWSEIKDSRESASQREAIVSKKEQQWLNVAALIAKEDPEAYQHLTGANGWDRAGTGFLAVLSALFFAIFDITTSLLIILGFLLIRWAVVALPLIGTVAILRPASGGFKRLVSAVVAAIINVVVFGVASAVYLYAASQILSANIPGWLQVLLIALIGVAAWMLLRPYRRIGSLKGGSSVADAAFGRRKQTVNEQKTVVKNDGKFRTETVPEESVVPRRETASESLVASKEANASSSLPPRPVPGQASSRSSSVSRSGYSVYRPSGASASASSSVGERPLVTVRPD